MVEHGTGQQKPVRIMVADGHALVRAGLRQILEAEGLFQVVAEAGTAAEAVEQVVRAAPQVVLLDVDLPDASGAEACKAICRRLPAVRAVILGSERNPQVLVESARAGAYGFLLKDVRPEELVHALDIVSRGGSLLTPDLVVQMLEEVSSRAGDRGVTDPSERLTGQEWEILERIADGKTNREIGQELYLSEHTVKNYVSRILDKLGLSRRSEAAAFVARREREGAVGSKTDD